MASTEKLNIVIKIVTNANQKLDKIVSKIQKTGDAAKVAGGKLDIMRRKLKALSAGLLGAGLAMLFFGMAVKNAAQLAIKSFAKTFTEVTQGTALYNETLGRVTASFEFLKFAIADAFLTSALGMSLVDTLIQLFDWISAMEPETLKWIGVLLVTAFIFGFILFIAGQLFLAFLGVVSTIAVIAFFAWLGVVPFIIMLLIVGLIALGLLLIIGGFVAMLFGQKKVAKIFFIIAAICFAIALILALIFAAPILGVIAFILLVAALGLALMNASDKFQLTFLKALGFIGKSIFTSIIGPLELMLRLLSHVPFASAWANKALRVINKGKEMAGLVDPIARLEAKIAANQAEQAANPVEEVSMKDQLLAKGNEFKDSITQNFTGDIVMPEGTDMSTFGADITEAAQFNASAGTG